MKRLVVLLTITALLSSLSTSIAVAQGRRQSPGSGRMGWGSRVYDPTTLETVSGEIVSITQTPSRRGQTHGVHLLLQTETEPLEVHLGPAWYLDEQGFEVETGDRIEVRGSRIDFAGTPALIAAEVTKGEETFTLRDENGVPVWQGWRR